MNVIRLCWWHVKIGSGNGLVPVTNKSLCWPRSISPYDLTRPQTVKTIKSGSRSMLSTPLPILRPGICALIIVSHAMKYVYGCVVLLPWWCHQIEAFSALLALCVGIHRSPVNSPHKDQWCGALLFSLFSKQSRRRWFEAHCAHYDVTVMAWLFF